MSVLHLRNHITGAIEITKKIMVSMYASVYAAKTVAKKRRIMSFMLKPRGSITVYSLYTRLISILESQLMFTTFALSRENVLWQKLPDGLQPMLESSGYRH